MAGLTRRSFMAAGTVAGLGGIGLRGGRAYGATTPPAAGAAPALLADVTRLATAEQLGDDVAAMVGYGSRLTATAPHRAFIDSLDEGFQRACLGTHRDSYSFMQWLAKDYAIDILDGPAAGSVPVTSYYTYSGNTGPAGVTGALVYAGPLPTPALTGDPTALFDQAAALQAEAAVAGPAITALLAAVPGGVSGRIVMVEAPVAPLTIGAFDPLLTQRYDPDGTLSDTSDYKRFWTTILTLPTLAAFKAAGALGVVFVMDASAANTVGQYTPFIQAYQDFPALIVDRDTGATLRTIAAGTPNARLVLDASYLKQSSDSLVATLPGDGSTGEVLIVNTHTDGMNAFEENGGVACLRLAQYLAGLPAGRRLKRNVVFSLITGHFGPGLPQTQGFIDAHPEYISRAAASITIEHFGAKEWLDDAQGYHASGLVEPGVAFASQTPIQLSAIDATRAADLRRFELLRPIADTYFGVGAALHSAGVPSVAYIAGPSYLINGATAQLDKLDPQRFHSELLWTTDLLHRLDTVSASTLAAGDSAALRPGIAVATPLAFPAACAAATTAPVPVTAAAAAAKTAAVRHSATRRSAAAHATAGSGHASEPTGTLAYNGAPPGLAQAATIIAAAGGLTAYAARRTRESGYENSPGE